MPKKSVFAAKGKPATSIKMPKTIVKRDGRVMPFEVKKIEKALELCFEDIGRRAKTPLAELSARVVNVIGVKYPEPSVEQVQDTVELVLQSVGEFEAAKHYILYRAEHAKLREVRPIPEEVRQAFADSDVYFENQIQKFQYYDKYARFNYELGRRETWKETVNRSVDFLHELSAGKLPASTYERLRLGILQMKVAPSMRLLAMAGGAARRNNICIYNCSYQPVDSLDAFVEAMIISMNGCGVGYSVESQYVENLPRVKRQSGAEAKTMVIEDTTEGWAMAMRTGLTTWFEGGDIKFDFSLLRPAGAILMTKGGRSSGPEPLKRALEFARGRIFSRQGSFLRPIDAHDIMCEVGNAAVSGGMRRTAMISLFDFDDVEMRTAKSGDFERDNNQRWNANNSAVWPSRGLTQNEVIKQMLDMFDSGRGEPGIFNRQAAIDLRPARRKEAEFGTNPCLTADAWVMTGNGKIQISDLIGKDFQAVVDGKLYKAKGFWETGVKPVIKLKTKDGYELRLTGNHKVMAVSYLSRKIEKYEWLEAGKLKVGDKIRLHDHREYRWDGEGKYEEGWLLGELVGDGTFDKKTARLVFWGDDRKEMADRAVEIIKKELGARSDFKGHNQVKLNRTVVGAIGLKNLALDYGIYKGMKKITPFIESSSSDFYCGFLRGLFDADGTVVGTQIKGVSVRLAQSDLEVLKATQRMLLCLGIISVIYENRRPAGLRSLPDGHGGYAEYYCQINHELVIANDNLEAFAEKIGFFEPSKKERLEKKLSGYKRKQNRERFFTTVESIEPDGEEMVYDCQVEGIHAFDANGLYVHNCGEIVLRPFEFCNLSISVARKDDTYETLRDKVEMATIIGTIQSLATHFPGLRPAWKQNCEEERLLGVDITGQLDSRVAQDPAVMNRLRQVAVETNRMLAGEMGINQSAAVTCVKPSGNSAQLFNCSSGIHARWSAYYVRNIRIGVHTPIYKVLKDVGVPMDPENGQAAETANTYVIHFPVKSPEGAITRNSVSAVSQCEYWLINKTYWTEHNPSVTITYHPEEVIDLIDWVWKHRNLIGGMTFLPSFDASFVQMPYQEIDKEEYEKLAAVFPQIDFSKLYRYEEEDYTKAAQELACVAGACEVDYSEGKPA